MKAIQGGKAKHEKIDAHKRLPASCVGACSPKPMSIRLRGARRAISSAAAVSWRANGLSLLRTSSFSTAPTVKKSLDPTPAAAGRDWTVSPAHLLGEASSSGSWLPLPRVWHELGVSSDTTRRFEQTGTRAQKSCSGVVPTGATVLSLSRARLLTLHR
jgi:hypothetical protein